MAEKKGKLQAVFFDFDGVLADSTQTKTQGFISLFKAYDDDVIDKVIRHHQQHGGISRVDKIKHAHAKIIGTPLTEDELGHWAEHYSKLVVQKVIHASWIEGAKAFLDSCPGHMKIFVISGTPEKELRYVLQERKMARYFDEILGSPVRKPAHIRSLVKKYQLAPECCVFIGDALTDYHAAMKTGLHFIGIRGDVAFPDGTLILPDCRGLKAAIEKSCDW